jgi:hypothetical protein
MSFDQGAGDLHVLREGDLPTPFTADEIRAGNPVGSTIRMRIERAGADPMIHVSRYVLADDHEALRESWDESLDGERLGEPEESRETWLQLQEHASFPAVETRIDEEVIDLPIGRVACVRYTQATGDGGRTFWFARDLPGQPVRWEIRRGDEVLVSVTAVEIAGLQPSA